MSSARRRLKKRMPICELCGTPKKVIEQRVGYQALTVCIPCLLKANKER